MPHKPSRIRWEDAQAAELAWWENWSRMPFYRDYSFPERWTNLVSGLIGDPETLPRSTIVEVGCGPHGIVRYVFGEAHLKVGIDPLACRFKDRPSAGKGSSYIAATGEKLPLADETADLVFCMNVLDHVIDADQILREIRRILKPGGRLALEVHTFPRPLTPFMFFDRPHTYHWSRDQVIKMVRDAGYAILVSETEAFGIDLSWASWFKPAHWKYVFGKLFMRLSYVYCEK